MKKNESLVSFITHLAQINSGSHNVAGCRKVLGVFKKIISNYTDDVVLYKTPRIIHVTDAGQKITQQFSPVLHARINPQAEYRICLFGHVDTVFGTDDPFQNVIHSGNILHGPGVCDMKGGIVVMLEGIKKFLATTTPATMGLDILLNADEEIGSLSSSQYLLSYCPQYAVALGYEPALPCGNFAGNRKGGRTFTIIAKGVSAHAGRDFTKGINAVAGLSRLSVFCDDLWRQYSDLTINTAQLIGGKAVNIVPDTAILRINMRSFSQDILQQSYFQITEYAQSLTEKYGVMFEFIQRNDRKPKMNFVAQDVLQSIVARICKDIGFSHEFKKTGGMCDGNLFSGEYIPTIDTLGVIGDHIHTSHEYLDISKLNDRIELTYRILADLNQNHIFKKQPQG